MKKVMLSFVSTILLFSFYQLLGQDVPEKIIFTIQGNESKYVVSRGGTYFTSAFYYLKFLKELEFIRSDEDYQEEQEECLGISIEKLVFLLRKIKKVLSYQDQIDLLWDEIREATAEDFIDIKDLNKIIIQFHPVKALRFKSCAIKCLLALFGGYFVYRQSSALETCRDHVKSLRSQAIQNYTTYENQLRARQQRCDMLASQLHRQRQACAGQMYGE